MGWDALRELRLSREQLAQRRLQAAKDLQEGVSEAEVARRYGVSAVSAWRWHQTLKKEGVEGLQLRKARGADPKLTEAQKKRLARIIDEGPSKHGGSTDLWTSKRVVEVVRKEFGIRYHRNHVPRLLHALGYRPRKPEREASQKDPAKKEKWLRTTWTNLKKT